MYLARSYPLIKPASFHLLIGYMPFDASAPPKRCRVLASVGPYDSGACSAAKMPRTKSLAPYCHHHHHHQDAFAGITLRTNIRPKSATKKKKSSLRTFSQNDYRERILHLRLNRPSRSDRKIRLNADLSIKR
jgi:hypothetical protein